MWFAYVIFPIGVVVLFGVWIAVHQHCAYKAALKQRQEMADVMRNARLSREPFAEGGERGTSRRTRVLPHEPIVVTPAMVLHNEVDRGEAGGRRSGGGEGVAISASPSVPTAQFSVPTTHAIVLMPSAAGSPPVPAHVVEEPLFVGAAEEYGEAVYLPRSPIKAESSASDKNGFHETQ